MDSWHARSWTLERFRTEHGRVQFPVNRSYSRAQAPTLMTLREYIDGILAEGGGGGLYLAGVEFLNRIPSLMGDFSFPDYVWWRRLANTLLFVGGAGARSPLHVDYSHTLLAQVAGQKRITLFAPEKTEWLEPLPREPFQTFSGLELTPSGSRRGPGAGASSDVSAFDRIRRERADFDFVLSPGEILFLPYGWWHAVESLEPSISISHSWWTLSMLLSEAPYLAGEWLRYRLRRRKSSVNTGEDGQDWLGF